MSAPFDDRTFHRAVGQRLAAVRKSRRLTQAQLAERVEMDMRTIQRAESGESALSIARMRRVAVALDLPVDELFRNVDAPIPVLTSDPQAPRLLALWTQIPPARRTLALDLLEVLARSAEDVARMPRLSLVADAVPDHPGLAKP